MARYINSELLREIKRKVEKIRGKNEDCLICDWIYRLNLSSMDRESFVHSCKIEFPEERFTEYSKSVNKKDKRRMVRRLQDAYRRSYQKLLYEGVTEELIKELAGSIDPLVHPNKVATYRVLGRNPITGQEHFTNVRPQGASITPPYPDKIPLEMKRYIQELFELQRGKTIESFLNSAAFAHLHLARIHPFEDTNGRTARTLQNLILRSGKLPPAIIHAGERFDYYQHLDTAISGWKTRTGQQLMEPSDGEKEFFNYIAGKVNVVLERVL